MPDFSYDYSVLVICERDFSQRGKDCDSYITKLNGFLTTRAGESTYRPVTVSGNYGLPFETIIDVDDRNKTSFIRSLDDSLQQFDEIVIITNFENDPYIEALSNRAAELSKTFTIYGYETR